MALALVTAVAPHDVATTVTLLTSALRRRDITLFATIDHAEGARRAGLELDDEVVMIFGNPLAGTALMQADPRAGLDLPLRILVWAQAGETRLAFHDPHALADDYALAGREDTLGKLRAVLDGLVAEVTA